MYYDPIDTTVIKKYDEEGYSLLLVLTSYEVFMKCVYRDNNNELGSAHIQLFNYATAKNIKNLSSFTAEKDVDRFDNGGEYFNKYIKDKAIEYIKKNEVTIRSIFRSRLNAIQPK